MENVLGGICNTPMVELRGVVPSGSARVVVKLEWANPTGSMKDRMARAAIDCAEASGQEWPSELTMSFAPRGLQITCIG